MTTFGQEYTLAVGDASATLPVQQVTQFDTVTLSFNLDSGCECSFNVPGNSDSARVISSLASDVWVYRNGVLLYRFRIISIEQTWDSDGADTVAVQAVDYKRILNARHVLSELSYIDVPQADVITGLIAHTQGQPGGSLGITTGTLDSDGITRTRNYEIGQNIGALLADYSSIINGPYWSIDALLQVNVGTFDGFPTNRAPIQLGSTARSLSRGSGAGEFANSVYVDGDSDVTTPVVTDAADILTDPRGRWERASGFPNVVLQATLVEKSQGLVEATRSPLATWACDIEPARYLLDANYQIGEFVDVVVPPTVAAPIGNPGFSVTTQIMNVGVSLTADGEASVEVEAIEVPAP